MRYDVAIRWTKFPRTNPVSFVWKYFVLCVDPSKASEMVRISLVEKGPK